MREIRVPFVKLEKFLDILGVQTGMTLICGLIEVVQIENFYAFNECIRRKNVALTEQTKGTKRYDTWCEYKLMARTT